MFTAHINWKQFAWALCYPLSFFPLGPPGWRDKRDYIDKLPPGYLESRHRNAGIPASWDSSVVKLNLLPLTKMLRSRQSKPARQGSFLLPPLSSLTAHFCDTPCSALDVHTTNRDKHSRLESYSQTGKIVNTKNISGMLLCCKKEANQREKTKPQAKTLISSLWFCG